MPGELRLAALPVTTASGAAVGRGGRVTRFLRRVLWRRQGGKIFRDGKIRLSGATEALQRHRRFQTLQKEYAAFRLREFQRRLLPTLLAIAIMFLLFAAGSMLLPEYFPAISLRLVIAVIVIQAALAALSMRCRTLRVQQGIALAAAAVPLIASTPLLQWSGATGTVIVFFLGLLFPWNGREAVLGASVPLLLQTLALRHGVVPDLFACASLLLVVCLQTLREQERKISFVNASEADETRKELVNNLHFAARVHTGLITPTGQVGPLQVALYYQPLFELGGDYFKARALDENRAALFIADVTGHGIPSALMVNRINAEVELILAAGLDPDAAMTRLNHFVMCHFAGTGMLMTAVWLEIDHARRRLRWVNCGHPHPLLATTAYYTPLNGGNHPLGIMPVKEFTRQETVLPDEGKLLLYTDGLLDVAEGKPPIPPSTIARWCSELAEANTGVEMLFTRLAEKSDRKRGGIRRDDLLMVMIKW